MVTSRHSAPHRTKRRRSGAARRRARPAARPHRAAPAVWSQLSLEVDLVHEAFRRRGLPFLHSLEAVFREREVVEVEGLLRLTAKALHALATQGFSRVDHWEVHPGGWLPLPEPTHERLEEPVGHLLNALRSEAWRRVAGARSFSVRLSGPDTVRGDLTVRRVHRERGHSLSLDLAGRVTDPDVRGIEHALRGELSIARLRRANAVANEEEP